jgi:hypothetical protein
MFVWVWGSVWVLLNAMLILAPHTIATVLSPHRVAPMPVPVKRHHCGAAAGGGAVGAVLPPLRCAFEHRHHGCVVLGGYRHRPAPLEARQERLLGKALPCSACPCSSVPEAAQHQVSLGVRIRAHNHYTHRCMWSQVMICAFLATLVLGVQTGVLVAMGFSLVLFVSKSSKPHIAELGRLFGELPSVLATGIHKLLVAKRLMFVVCVCACVWGGGL